MRVFADAAAENGPGGDVDVITDRTIVFDESRSIDDRVASYARPWIHHRSGEHDRAFTNARSR